MAVRAARRSLLASEKMTRAAWILAAAILPSCTLALSPALHPHSLATARRAVLLQIPAAGAAWAAAGSALAAQSPREQWDDARRVIDTL